MDRERSVHRSITGEYPCVFRPPGGAYNDTTLTLARDRRMTLWNWSVDTEDWKAQGSGDQYWIDRIRSRGEDGASQPHPVILLHNQVVGNPATVAARPPMTEIGSRTEASTTITSPAWAKSNTSWCASFEGEAPAPAETNRLRSGT